MKKSGESLSRDLSLDTLLDLDGVILVVDEKGGHWVNSSAATDSLTVAARFNDRMACIIL